MKNACKGENIKEFYPLIVFEGEDRETVKGKLIVNGKKSEKEISRKQLEQTYY